MNNIRFHLNRPPLPIDNRLYAVMREANIGARYWGAMVSYLDESVAHRESVVDYVRNYEAKEAMGSGLLFYGDHGSGKTALLSILLREAMRRAPCSAWFTPITDLDWTARHRDSVGPTGVPIWDLITRAQVVAIDDVGSERQAEWNDCWFEEVIRARYNNRLTTHMATNLKLEDLLKKAPWFGSIIRDSFTVIRVDVSPLNTWR